MTTAAIAEPEITATSAQGAANARRVPAWTWLAGPISGLLLYAAFPPLDLPWLAWIALVPLMALLRQEVPTRRALASAWLGGLAFWVPSIIWIWELHPSAWLAWWTLAVYQSIYWPLFVLLARLLYGGMRWPFLLAAPVAWVACEYIQAFALSGFPWYYLAHSQYRFLALIQISDLVGAWGVSFVVALVNAWVVGVIGRPWRGRGLIPQVIGTTAVVATLVATYVYSYVAMRAARFVPGPRVVLLQSSLRQALKMSKPADEIIALYAGLIQSALDRSAREHQTPPDLIVWPETSYPWGFVTIEPGTTPAELDRAADQLIAGSTASEWLDRRALALGELRGWSRGIGSPMLVGAVHYELGPEGGRKSNAALWIDARRQTVPLYRKVHLVPFGEYIPLLDVIPWIKRLAPYDDRNLPRLVGGAGPVWFDDGTYRYANAICFEDTLPHHVRRSFAEAPDGRQPNVLANISNDGWFNGTAEHDLHLAISVFRAVENRVPVIRSANMGYSAVIDGNGRVLARIPKRTEDALEAVVPLDPRTSLYSSTGDWLAQGCLIVSVGLGAVVLLRRVVPARRVGAAPH
jgi:apolipoprotein N-acyltransferase